MGNFAKPPCDEAIILALSWLYLGNWPSHRRAHTGRVHLADVLAGTGAREHMRSTGRRRSGSYSGLCVSLLVSATLVLLLPKRERQSLAHSG